MKRYLHYLGPSLIRRVVIAILVAFAVCWVVLAIYGYLQETDPVARDKTLLVNGQALVAALEKTNTNAEALKVISSYSEIFNLSYKQFEIPRVMLLQLKDAAGHQIFLSPEAGGHPMPAARSPLFDAEINGEMYRVFHAKTPRWDVMWAAPILNSSWFFILVIMEMTVQMLIALPIMVLITWLVVARGLKPLRVLSNLIAAKNKDDLSPIEFNSPYAELKPLTAALDRLLSQLRSKIAREHAFVQDAAHELRTPMAVISAQAHVLTKAETATERHLAEKNLESAIQRSSHLIAQLLEMSHIDNDKLEAAERIDVAALLQQELARLAPAAMARQIELSLDAPHQLQCQLDANLLQTIVQNLLNNAILYVNEGDHIEVQLCQHHNELQLIVADNGPGIPLADRERVFERFYRGAGHDVAGTGLGLAIVAQAVARLQGQIELSTGLEERGCSFTVTIPLYDSKNETV